MIIVYCSKPQQNDAVTPTPLAHRSHTCMRALALGHDTYISQHTLLLRDDLPTPAGHLRIPPLHRHRQLHLPVHKCTLGNAPTPSRFFIRRFTNFTTSLPMYPHVSTANGTNRNSA